MLVVTETFPEIVLEDIKNDIWCTKLIQDNYRLTLEEAEIFYDILRLNNRLILPLNRHQVMANLYFYVGYESDNVDAIKKDIVRYDETFYVVRDLETSFASSHPIIKLSKIEDSSICYVDASYLRSITITNILNDLI